MVSVSRWFEDGSYNLCPVGIETVGKVPPGVEPLLTVKTV
jgi:hypothetical protein